MLSSLEAWFAAGVLARNHHRLRDLWLSQEHGFEKAKLETLLKSAETKQPILDAISKPAERVIPWHEYRDRFLTEKRITDIVLYGDTRPIHATAVTEAKASDAAKPSKLPFGATRVCSV